MEMGFFQGLMGTKSSDIHTREKRMSESHFDCINRMYVSDNVNYLNACVLIRAKNIDF